MFRFLGLLLVSVALISCSKNDKSPNPPVVIPNIINGVVSEFSVTPLDITTPDKGSFFIFGNNNIYNVEFNATDQAQSNAVLSFKSDTILTEESRQFADRGRDAIAYNPVAANEIEIRFYDGRNVRGLFDVTTTFGGLFGEQLISQWRDLNDPAKPNQKAKDDIRNFVRRYSDEDGPGPGNTPVYLSVTISKR